MYCTLSAVTPRPSSLPAILYVGVAARHRLQRETFWTVGRLARERKTRLTWLHYYCVCEQGQFIPKKMDGLFRGQCRSAVPRPILAKHEPVKNAIFWSTRQFFLKPRMAGQGTRYQSIADHHKANIAMRYRRHVSCSKQDGRGPAGMCCNNT